MMKNSVKLNLKNLYLENRRKVDDISINDILNKIITDNPEALNLNSGETVNLYDEEEIENFRLATKNKKLAEKFNYAKELDFHESQIINDLKQNLKNSFSIAKDKFISNESQEKNQIIFLEHNYQPYAYLCGYGEGDYPILKNPEYLNGFHQKEFYNGVGNIDYSPIWKGLINLIALIEELEIDDAVREDELFLALEKMTLYKTYILINRALEELGESLFSNMSIKKPLFIFGNEHDCEPINIYVLE